MARTKIQIDETWLRKVIKECEESKVYTARSALFQDVANKYNQNLPIIGLPATINAQLVYLRVNELGIDLATPKGKRGRSAGFRPTGVKVSRSAKIASNEQAKKSLDAIRKDLNRGMLRNPKEKPGAVYLPLVDKMEQGSLRAAIKMMCLQCTNFQKEEIKHCECVGCALYHIRPYQNNEKSELDTEKTGV